MLYYFASVGYTVANLLLALIVFLRSRDNLITQFYFICVVCLSSLGVAAYLLAQPINATVRTVLENVTVFVYAMLPFFFMHFITFYVRRADDSTPRRTFLPIYAVGLFAYTMIQLGWIPKPITVLGKINQSGYVFYITWMSIFFSIGISLLYERYRGFRNKAHSVDVLFIGFMLLLLLLPGPFTDSIFFGIMHLSVDWYFYICTSALIVAVYFIFRHKIIVNTIYDALRSALAAMNDILMITNEHLEIEVIRGRAVTEILGYEETDLIGRAVGSLAVRRDELEAYRSRVAAGDRRESCFDVDMWTKAGVPISMNFSFTPILVNDQFTGFVGVGRDVTERKRAEIIQQVIYRISQSAEGAQHLPELYKRVHEIIREVMPAGNFYISLYDERTDLLSFPYFVDEVEETVAPYRPGKGLTEYVLRTGRSLLCDHATEDQLRQSGEIELVGAPSATWLGVPLNAGKKTIGVMAVQHYSNEHAYGEHERTILEYVSSQVAKEIERKKVEVELQLLGHMMESISEIVTITDLKDEITYVNTAFVRKYGYAKEEIIGKHISILWSASIPRERIDEMMSRSRVSGWQGELLNLTRDGREFPISLNTTQIRDENGQVIGLVGVTQDITEKKRAEEALRSSEEKFRSLFARVPDGVYQSTPDDRIITANPAFARMLQYESEAELLGLNLSRDVYYHSGERAILRQRLDHDTELRNVEVVLRRKDGQPVTVLENAHVVRDHDGAILYYEGTLTDITERKRLEGELRQSQKLESLGTLAGGIAHDFNNILQIILVNTSSLQRHNRDVEKMMRILDINKKAIERGASLVQQVLTFARKTEVRFEPLNVNTVVQDILKMLSETFPKTITFSSTLDPQLPAISADHNQMHQILLNLCVNARDAMHQGGHLSIGSEVISRGEMQKRFPAAREDRYVCLRVSDTGQGMDETTRSRIFEPFFTTKEKGKGTGLGLAVVYGIIDTHRGFIDVQSKVGFGTTFRVYLPIGTDGLEARGEETKGVDEIRGGSEIILVVEDEEVLLNSIAATLEERGYRVLVAKDGQEAVRVFAKHCHEIDLVITDIGLPKLSGWEAFQKMREIKPEIRGIVASGYLDPELRTLVPETRAQDVLLKPYKSAEILRMVRRVLDARQN